MRVRDEDVNPPWLHRYYVRWRGWVAARLTKQAPGIGNEVEVASEIYGSK